MLYEWYEARFWSVYGRVNTIACKRGVTGFIRWGVSVYCGMLRTPGERLRCGVGRLPSQCKVHDKWRYVL